YRGIALASVAMGGVGIWSMHFVGMVALKLPVPHGYSLWETVVSLGVAVVATAASFSTLVARPNDRMRLLLAAVLLGLGVCAMHYLGMYGMRFDGYFIWSVPVVLASLVLSVVGAAIALWLVFSAQSDKALRAAPVVMAAAVSGMHYIAMSAAGFVCTVVPRGNMPSSDGIVGSNDLTVLITASLLVIMAVLALDQWLWSSPQMIEDDDLPPHQG
ncbi:MAG: histidine kinase, partial [Rubrivivax sp.]